MEYEKQNENRRLQRMLQNTSDTVVWRILRSALQKSDNRLQKSSPQFVKTEFPSESENHKNYHLLLMSKRARTSLYSNYAGKMLPSYWKSNGNSGGVASSRYFHAYGKRNGVSQFALKNRGSLENE